LQDNFGENRNAFLRVRQFAVKKARELLFDGRRGRRGLLGGDALGYDFIFHCGSNDRFLDAFVLLSVVVGENTDGQYLIRINGVTQGVSKTSN
jgi:hypothetical protein